MSFLIDKAADFLRYGPRGKEVLSAEDAQAQKEMIEAAKSYKAIVGGWLLAGVSKARIKKAGLWIEELMRVNVQAMGGGPGAPGLPLAGIITPGGIDRSGVGRGVDRAFVTRVVNANRDAQAVQAEIDRRGVTSGRGLSVVIDQAPDIIARARAAVEASDTDQKVNAVLDQDATYETIRNSGGADAAGLQGTALLEYQAWEARNYPQAATSSSSSSSGSSNSSVAQGTAIVRTPVVEEKRSPEAPWLDVWPTLMPAARGANGLVLFLNDGWRPGYDAMIARGEKISQAKAKTLYAEAVKLYGGKIVGNEMVKQVVRAMLAVKVGLVKDSEVFKTFELVWGRLSKSERQKVLDAFVEQGIDLSALPETRGVSQEALDMIRTNRSNVIAILQRISTIIPTLRSELLLDEILQNPPSPNRELRDPSLEDDLKAVMPELEEHLRNTGMSTNLIAGIISNLNLMTFSYGLAVHSRGGGDVTGDEARGTALTVLYRAVSTIVRAQQARDTTTIVNPAKIMEIMKLLMTTIPTIRDSIAAGTTRGQAAIKELIERAAGREQQKIVKDVASNPEVDEKKVETTIGVLEEMKREAGVLASDIREIMSGVERDEGIRDTMQGDALNISERMNRVWNAASESSVFNQGGPDPTATYARIANSMVESIGRQAASGQIALRLKRFSLYKRYFSGQREPIIADDVPDSELTATQIRDRQRARDRARFDELKGIRKRVAAINDARAAKQKRIAEENKRDMATDGLDRKHAEPGDEVFEDANELIEADPIPRRYRDDDPGDGGDPGDDPGDDAIAIQEIRPGRPPRNWLATISQIARILGIVSGLLGTAAYVYKIWRRESLRQIEEGEVVEIDIKNGKGPTPAPESEPESEPTVENDIGDNYSATNITQPATPTVMDPFRQGYMQGGYQPPIGDRFAPDPSAPKPVPIGESAKSYKIVSPELAPPPVGRYDPKKDETKKYDLKDPGIKEIIRDRPEEGELILKQNDLTDLYNKTKASGDKELANEIYQEMRLNQTEIDNNAVLKTTRSAGEKGEMRQWTYKAKSGDGRDVELYAARTITERSVALGLDDNVRSYNKNAEAANRLLYKDRDTWTQNEMAEFTRLQRKIDMDKRVIEDVESQPDLATGKVEPKIVEKQIRGFKEGQHQYPRDVIRVIDKIRMSSPGQPVMITEEEREAIAKFPELEEKVAKYEDDVKQTQAMPITRGGRVFQAFTPESIENMSSINEFEDIAANGYKGPEPVESSLREVNDALDRDRAELRVATSKLKKAIDSNAPRGQINDLYLKQAALKQKVQAGYEEASGRETYIDPSRESLPGTQEEVKVFQRLQNVERAYQGRPDELAEYNQRVESLNPYGKTRSQIYAERLAILQGIASKYGSEGIYEKAATESVDDPAADDTIARIPDNTEPQKDQGVGMERANYIDPNEQALFLGTPAQNARQNMKFETFSYVPPGFGLGTPATNPLIRHQQKVDAARAKGVRVLAPARDPRPKQEVRGPVTYQHSFKPDIFSDFGEVSYEDNRQNYYQDGKRVLWSDSRPNSANRTAWENPGNIYQPDIAADWYMRKMNTKVGPHAVSIGETVRPATYSFLPKFVRSTENGFMPRVDNRMYGFPDDGDNTMYRAIRSGWSDITPNVAPRGKSLRDGVIRQRRR